MIFTCTENSCEADSSETTEYLCDDEPRPKVCAKDSLKLYQRKHRREKQYRCTENDKQCTKKWSLKVLRRRHAGEHWYCSQCEKHFSCLNALYSHKNIHAGKYKCTECGKSLRNSSELSRHIGTHAGRRDHHTGHTLYRCHACRKVFRDPGILQIHMRVHSGDEPYM